MALATDPLTNGQSDAAPAPAPSSPRVLPDAVELSAAVARRIPAPGTQRELKAQTGRSFDELCGADADGADRIQTLIWIQLRRQIPGLQWDECADIDGIPTDDGPDAVDPTTAGGSGRSPASAASGG